MISHQSPYGQTIRINCEEYFGMTDQELKDIEDRYANSLMEVVFLRGDSADPDIEVVEE